MTEPFATGGCQCGAVRYAANARPFSADFCHCRMCQRAVGNVFGAFADFKAADVEWTSGRPKLYDSSSAAERGFCGDCGTPLSFAYKGKPWISLTIGSFDDPELVPITNHSGVQSKVSWLKLCDGLPENATGSTEIGAKLIEGMVSNQSPEGEA